MYASYNTRITATDFTAMTGLIWLAVVVAAGVRRSQFAVVAGLVYAIVPHLVADYVTDSVHLPVVLFGLAGLALANDPDGYCAAISIRRHRHRSTKTGAGVPVSGETGPAPAATPASASASGSGTPPALELRDLHAGYDGAPVLHGVGIAVHPGEIVALLGPNGAGKSTTCRTAAGLLTPLRGQVYVAGRDVTREGPVRRARAGVLLAPEGRGIFPALTIEENLTLHLPDKHAREAVYERFAGLAARRNVTAGALSGGEQQLLALAPLLQEPPRVLIADEPSLGLAPRIVEDVFRLLTELRDAGTGLLLVEEKATEILGVADTVAYLDRGRVSWCGPRADVRADRLTEAYLGLAASGPGTAQDTAEEGAVRP